MSNKSKTICAKDLENLRFLLYQAWNAASEMQHNQACIEQLGNDIHYQNKLLNAKECLKGSWMAIEATGIMPSLFSEAATMAINETGLLLTNGKEVVK